MRKTWIELALLVALLNLLDAALTKYAIGIGKGLLEEANPIMKLALENNTFMQIKILVSLCICALCFKVDSLLIKIVIVITLVFYSFINLYHIFWLRVL